MRDLTGQQFGRLTVLERAPNRGRNAMWVCECSCDKHKTSIVRGGNLISGRTKSCECRGVITPSHGHTSRKRKSAEYQAWGDTRTRVYNTKRRDYKYYGERGVAVCDRWRFGEDGKSGFECFLEDMGPRPSPEHSLDRYPDRNGNYELRNCRWATAKEQANNRRDNIFVTVNSQTQTLPQWSQKLGLPEGRLRGRLHSVRLLDGRIRRTEPADVAAKLKMIDVLARKAQSLIRDLSEAKR